MLRELQFHERSCSCAQRQLELFSNVVFENISTIKNLDIKSGNDRSLMTLMHDCVSAAVWVLSNAFCVAHHEKFRCAVS